MEVRTLVAEQAEDILPMLRKALAEADRVKDTVDPRL